MPHYALSGPSKSGKTVLIKKVIPEENLIPISGGTVLLNVSLHIVVVVDEPSTDP
jgi:molybdopterin-guanine dinucleotide biosynthesis protein